MNRPLLLMCTLAFATACGPNPTATENVEAVPEPVGPALAFSRSPPGGFQPSQVPQFVSVTFDDNFGLEEAGAPGGGMNFIIDFWGKHKNPAGRGNAATFDGTPLITSFYYTTEYIRTTIISPEKPGDQPDPNGLNKKAWTAAFAAGHEAADHTIHHYNGGDIDSGTDPCCKARHWDVTQWTAEIKGAKDTLISPTAGIGAKDADVIGFRTPFLGYNDAVFSTLQNQRFSYDSTLPNCFDDSEDGKNCSWPYTLDSGSPDVDVLVRKFRAPPVQTHAGLWEAPPTTLIVPPDSAAVLYGFSAGLRSRIPTAMPYPSLYERATGKLAGLDYTILIDAKCSPSEMLAILKYNLDLHLAGNRAPLIFIGHSFMYSYESGNTENTPSVAVRDARWKALTDFVTYALTKPEVRVRAVKDVLAWVRTPTPLTPSATDASVADAVEPPADGGATTGTGGSSGTGGGAAGAGGNSSGSGGTLSGSAGSATAGASTGAGGGANQGAPGSDGASSGCSCRLGPSNLSGAPAALLLALGMVLSRIRRAG